MNSRGALSGLKVLDFSTLLPGPMATLFLAEAGAEVIKIERPGKGEEMRSYVPRWGQDSVNFAMLNRGKKSLAVDLKNADDRARLAPLLEDADILVEQFRPGVMSRLGLGYEDVAKINPGIIYCSISGYGQSGPKHAAAGHDLNYIGDAGLLALSLGTAETPVIPPALIADIAGGTYPAVFNILLALRERDRSGGGCHIDIAMADNLFPFLYWAIGDGQAAGRWPSSGDALVTGGSCRYRLYPTLDGKFAAVAALEDKFWERFIATIGLESEFHDDQADQQSTTARVAELIGARDSAYWDARFVAADCCCSIVRTAQEAMRDPHFVARGVFNAKLWNESGEVICALPTPIAPAFRGTQTDPVRAPKLGEQNEIIFGTAATASR
ncbi:Crotonobetainyl-CoA:carnitine CoA-transferase CaiB [Sphingobium sp. AP50]|uniref:CaiB/BaiF CoA transferase family protein n=1 Tax=Sphingobium sp. AP50 TaxID=1884369 RepID=UPI0008AE8B40|nr:CaiB/BaiF CoA-transferase family protein [Sphingobium sp. AP50]SEJ66346.1 Crotonobetainyl-CoA:carnitine CoA-transferase CaiB [Sphingobium sp. AP50]